MQIVINHFHIYHIHHINRSTIGQHAFSSREYDTADVPPLPTLDLNDFEDLGRETSIRDLEKRVAEDAERLAKLIKDLRRTK